MKKLSHLVVKYSKIIVALFLASMVFSVFSMSWVDIENDVTVYLSDSTESKQGMMLMNEEFMTYATADVMVENISIDEAQEIADTLSEIDGVLMLGFDTSSDHYKENSALYNISFNGPVEKEGVAESFAAVKEALKEYDYYVSTDSFSSMSEILTTEMAGVVVIVIIAVLAVLIFTSSTYAEILVLVITFLAAALINMGTNFLLGTISFVSNAVAIVMQLALSIDYAIILCNRYKEEHEELPIKDAVISALALSIPEILASSLTTVAGLASLTFMEFRLGFDLGVALIKAIIISLITVFLFMPALLLLFGSLMDKTKHKNFVPKISFAGSLAYKARHIIPPLFVVLVIFGYISFGKVNYAYTVDLVESIRKSDDDIAVTKICDRFGENKMLPLMVPAGDYEKEAALIDELEEREEVNSVLGLAAIDAVDGYTLGDLVNYKDFIDISGVDENTSKALFAYYAADKGEYNSVTDGFENYSVPLLDLFLVVHEVAESGAVELPEGQVQQVKELYAQLKMAQDQLQGKNYSRIIMYVDLPEQGEKTFEFLDYVHAAAGTYYPGGEVYLAGMAVAARDFNETFKNDAGIVSTLSLAFVMLILLFSFKSVGMPILLILIIQGGIWINFSLSVWNGNYVYFMWYLIVSSIQMGANIDYAIVISSRYNQLRKAGFNCREAATDAVNHAFPTVITSGTIMVVAGSMIGLRVSYVVISGMGMYIGTGTTITILLVNFILPALLIFGDRFIAHTTLKLADRNKGFGFTAKGRKIATAATAAAALIMLAVSPLNLVKSGKAVTNAENETAELVNTTRSLKDIYFRLEKEEEEKAAVSMDFAEHLVTDLAGTEQLNEGIAEYEEGEATLEEYKAKLDAGEEAYREGYEEYEKGLAEYRAGQARLAQGQAAYDAGFAEYEEGKARLAQGQAEYDDGFQKYEQAKALLEAGEALYNEAQPIYALIIPLYDAFASAESRYEEAAAAERPNPIELAILQAEAAAARLAYENSIGGYSIGGLLDSIANAEQMIADGNAQLAEAEAQLAAGKAELDAGNAQLAEAEAQLAAGKAELDAGYAELYAGQAKLDNGWKELQKARAELDKGAKEIAKGEKKLDAAEKEIFEGAEMLAENRKKLEGDLAALEQLSDDKEKLRTGIDMLLSVDGISRIAGKGMNDAEICTVAETYFENQLVTLDKESKLMTAVSILLIAAAALAVASILLYRLKHFQPALVCVLSAAVIALAGALIWRSNCRPYTQTIFWAAAFLAASAAIMGELMVKTRKENKNGKHELKTAGQ